MTIQPRSILNTLVLAGLVLQPMAARAQNSRPASPATSAPRTAPAPATAPASTAPAAPASTVSAAPAARPAGAIATSRQATEDDYRLGAGDKLRIEVYHEPQISQSLQVRPDGKITLPLVGDVTASGRTSIELRDALTSSLKEYITNPVVTVIVQEAQANQIFVVGEVPNPGSQVLQGQMTALQAIALAGGLKEFADVGDIHVLRKMPSGTIQSLKFDYKGALKGRVEPMVLRPGDTVVVP
jgi:polysaccharide export outer membrane protein